MSQPRASARGNRRTATRDAPDGRTVRLAAVCVLEIATGALLRRS